MKVRNGFVSNSSSSSFIVQYLIQFPKKLPKTDAEIYSVNVGDEITEYTGRYGYNYEKETYPVSKAEMVKEIKRVFKKKKKIKKNSVLIQRMILDRKVCFENRIDETQKLLMNAEHYHDKGKFDSFLTEETCLERIQDYKNKIEFGLISFKEFSEIFKNQFQDPIYLIEEESGSQESFGCYGRGNYELTGRVGDLRYICPKTIPMDDLFKNIPIFHHRWRTYDDNGYEDEIYYKMSNAEIKKEYKKRMNES